MPQLDCPPRPVREAPRRAGEPRLVGVDVAHGMALFGTMAAHVFDDHTQHGPTGTRPLEELVGRPAARARRAVLRGSATPVGVAERE